MRKGKLQILQNIGGGHYQTSGDEIKIFEKKILDEQENVSKPIFAAEISSKGLTLGQFPLVRYSRPFLN